MVFVVERYLPGLSRSDLLRGLSRLEQAMEGIAEARAVRYLGSTIVLGDEACFCQFEGPSEAAVAEANRKAGLSFDRIVPAVGVQPERRTKMNLSATIPPTVQIRRGRLFGLIGVVAMLAAVVTWVLATFAVNTDTGTAQNSAAPTTSALSSLGPSNERFIKGIGSMAHAQQDAAVLYALGLSPKEQEYVLGITSLTPAEQAAAFGGRSGARVDSVGFAPAFAQFVTGIGSMAQAQQDAAVLYALGLSPKEQEYVLGITSLTPDEQAAAFGR